MHQYIVFHSPDHACGAITGYATIKEVDIFPRESGCIIQTDKIAELPIGSNAVPDKTNPVTFSKNNAPALLLANGIQEESYCKNEEYKSQVFHYFIFKYTAAYL